MTGTYATLQVGYTQRGSSICRCRTSIPARWGFDPKASFLANCYCTMRLTGGQGQGSQGEDLEEVDSGGYVAGGQDDPGARARSLKPWAHKAGSKVGLGRAKWSCFRFPPGLYWIGQKVLLGFPIRFYQKRESTFWPTQYISLLYCCLVTFCVAMDCSTSGFPILQRLPEFAQTNVL